MAGRHDGDRRQSTAGSGGEEAFSASRRFAPGKVPATSRLATPVQAHAARPVVQRAAAAAPVDSRSGSAAPAAPASPGSIGISPSYEGGSPSEENVLSVDCEAKIGAALPESGFLVGGAGLDAESRLAAVLESVSAADAASLLRRLGSPADPLGRRFAWFGPGAKHKLEGILRWREGRRESPAGAAIQRKADVAGATEDSAVAAASVQAHAARGVAGAGGALPHQSSIQASFGHHDVGSIEAHVGGTAAEAAADIGADAYATGGRVAFAQAPDLHTAAHEAAHVIQQRGGVDLDGGVGRAGDHYEQHADAVADQVVQGRSAEGLLDEKAGGAAATSGVQRHASTTPPHAPPEVAARLREELGATITANPPLGSGQAAYIGGRVEFGFRMERPSKTRTVKIAEWGLEVPSGGGEWRQAPVAPTVTLPIGGAGPHRFWAHLVVDGVEFDLEQRFQAIEATQRTDALVAADPGLSLDRYRSQLALQEALLHPPGPKEQGANSAFRIDTAAANPERQSEKATLSYSIKAQDPGAANGVTYRWYAKPFKWEGLPEALGGHPRTKLDDLGEAYDLGSGPTATLPASHRGTYLLVCRVDQGGKPRGEARYLQAILGDEEVKMADKLVEHGARVGRLGERIEGETVPVVASHVRIANAAETSLRLYLGQARGEKGKWLLLDLTPGLDPESNALEYDGASAAETLQKFQDGNRYPRGAISLRVDANRLGVPPMSRRFHTDGETLLGSLSSKAGLASLLLGLGAIVAAPFTGGGSLLVTALVVASATAAAAAGVLSLADHLKTEQVSQTAVALDVLSIATSFLNAGLAVRALRGGPAILVGSRGTRYLVWTNFTLEGVSAILVGVEGAEQIAKIAESEAPPEEKSRLMVAVIANMILTGTLLAVSYGDLKNTRSRLKTHLGPAADAVPDGDSLSLSLLDDTTLKSLKGADGKDLTRLAEMIRDDPSVLMRLSGRADILAALKRARGNKALDLELAYVEVRLQGMTGVDGPRLLPALRESGVTPASVPRFSDAYLEILGKSPVLDELTAVAALQRTGRVKGLGEWIEFGATKTGADLGRVSYELREARRRAQENPSVVINVGGDARAPTRPGSGEKMASNDMTVETRRREVIASVEVTVATDPAYHDASLTSSVQHGILKARARAKEGAPLPGAHHLTIVCELRGGRQSGGAGTRVIGRDGERRLEREDGGAPIPQGNFYDGMATNLGKIGDHEFLDRITLVDKASGDVLTEFVRDGNTWKRLPKP